MKYRQIAVDRHPNGDVDYFARGQRARLAGRPIWANPGIGQDAVQWRAGWSATGRADPSIAPPSSPAIPEFA